MSAPLVPETVPNRVSAPRECLAAATRPDRYVAAQMSVTAKLHEKN